MLPNTIVQLLLLLLLSGISLDAFGAMRRRGGRGNFLERRVPVVDLFILFVVLSAAARVAVQAMLCPRLVREAVVDGPRRLQGVGGGRVGGCGV